MFKMLLTHEIGHYSGLADQYNPGDPNYVLGMGNYNHPATMYGRIDLGETYKWDLHPDYQMIRNIFQTN